ncbi:hypothetical protein PQQ81_09455 [Paraburkholderia strydomiana]|uniref:hypothetical protein n=1 Tax=Paraburkholderia strydomiana TaxID=1245417 RepID=UPI0038B75F5E
MAIYLDAKLRSQGEIKETRANVEAKLGLSAGKLTEMCRQATRKRKDKRTGERIETESGGLEDWEFAQIAGKGYDKGRGRLTDQFIFEFSLGQLVESVQIQIGRGPNEAEDAAAEKRERDQIKALLNNRHEAHKIFADGLDNVRKGDVPWSKNGRRKKWTNATSAERRASFDGWIDKIEGLGCRVLDRSEWNDWFRMANPAGTMEQFLWHWCDGDDGEYSAACPPWVFGVELDYWDNYDALNSPEFLDSLILVTESDMPYSPYHKRFSQPKLKSSPGDPEIIVRQVDAEGWEIEWHGDDLSAWAANWKARTAQSEAEATALIDRASRRKSGGARL